MNDLLMLSAVATTASINPGLLNVLGITPANWPDAAGAMSMARRRRSAPATPGDVDDGGVTIVDDYISRWRGRI